MRCRGDEAGNFGGDLSGDSRWDTLRDEVERRRFCDSSRDFRRGNEFVRQISKCILIFLRDNYLHHDIYFCPKFSSRLYDIMLCMLQMYIACDMFLLCMSYN